MTDISKNCRLCLIGKNFRCIFGDSGNSINSNKKWALTNISSIIYDVTKIEVTVNDCTTGICITCYKEITSILNFRRRCTRANNYLKSKHKNDEQSVKLSTTSNENKNDLTSEHLPFIDVGDESSSRLSSAIASNSLWEKNDSFEEISDYEMPSPDLEDDEAPNFNDSDYMPEEELDMTDGNSIELENNCKRAQPKSRAKVKSSSKKSQEPVEDWPKLKKRDLIETKAYRGLCHLCGKEYQHLWVHLQSHSEVPTETCDKCGKGFRSKANLSLHILLHKEADMPCEVCGKKYRTKMRLKRHMRVHTQNRPFFCAVCQKRFYTKYNLEVHGRIHSGERPFSCSVKNCNERFAHSYALKHHLEKSHKHESITSN